MRHWPIPLRPTPRFPLNRWQPLQWEWRRRVDFRLVVERDKQSGSCAGCCGRGEERMKLNEPAMLLDGGVVIARGMVAPLNDRGAFSGSLARKKCSSRSLRPRGGPVAEIMQSTHLPEIDWPEELRVEEVPWRLVRPQVFPIEWMDKTSMRGRSCSITAASRFPSRTSSRLVSTRREALFPRDAEAERAAIQP